MTNTLSKEAISNVKNTDTISILGGSGFVGSSLLELLLPSTHSYCKELRIATRDTANQKLQKLAQSGHSDTAVNIMKCNQLTSSEVQKLIQNSNTIINLAGLAWQHPGGNPIPKKELFTHEVFQNAISTILMAALLEKEQTLIWTSTSAIDGMFARLAPTEKKELTDEANSFAQHILDNLNIKNKDSQTLFNSLEKIIDDFIFKKWAPFPGSINTTCFAFEYSYAYSKYIGQLLLEQLAPKNSRALKISDVYGPRQDISEKILNPLLPARRIQRYIAAFREISRGNIDWIPNDGSNIYGLFRDKNNKISQSSWSDWVFPTHVHDVCEIILRSLDPAVKKTVLNVNGNRISNRELMETIAGYFKTPITFNKNETPKYEMFQNSEDLPILGMSTKSLISFSEGLEEWVRND